MRFLSTALTAATVLGGTAHGYLIDPESCAGEKGVFVKGLVESAFAFANLGLSSVMTMDQDAEWLMKQLFNLEGDDALKTIENAFAVGQPNNKGDVLGISVFQDEKTGSLDELSKNEVVIFCDVKRLERRKADPLRLYDNKAKRAVGMTNGCGGAFMYTQTFYNHWDIIQVCPWFLEYAMRKTGKTTKDLHDLRTYMAVKGLDKFITNHVYTPVDLMALWDKSMLHEFMHTKPGGAKDDVDNFGSYGWKNCKDYAGKGKAVNNPDSYALFGSALWWMKQGSPIDENGNFKSEPEYKSPSDPSKRWLGSGAARGMEEMKMRAVEMFT